MHMRTNWVLKLLRKKSEVADISYGRLSALRPPYEGAPDIIAEEVPWFPMNVASFMEQYLEIHATNSQATEVTAKSKSTEFNLLLSHSLVAGLTSGASKLEQRALIAGDRDRSDQDLMTLATRSRNATVHTI
ncbi:hypothetical protein C8F04DRAFT_1242246 [Mycena alexandri]|uniref:Uncharacterized protein n=1 Tax=Mycena alexandri TaxID=1745969 RepID=A0AAD6S516_9AGAR|nr:hypothetical protein C8F04DRAFT_1242246 [Mycena alexandri]